MRTRLAENLDRQADSYSESLRNRKTLASITGRDPQKKKRVRLREQEKMIRGRIRGLGQYGL